MSCGVPIWAMRPASKTARTATIGRFEATLVRDLCVEGDMVLVLVAEIDGALAGLVAFSRMRVDVGGKSVAAVALAPIAVAPEWRRQGVADALVAAAAECPSAVLGRRAVAGEQHDTDLRVLAGDVERAVELIHGVRTERVAHLGPVERDACDSAVT